MPKERRKPMHFWTHILHDGTVLSAFPIRKPSTQELKRDRLRIDADGVARELADAGKYISNVDNLERWRFQDIIATNLNTRRAVRTLVLPALAELPEEVRRLHARLDTIESRMESNPACAPAPAEQ